MMTTKGLKEKPKKAVSSLPGGARRGLFTAHEIFMQQILDHPGGKIDARQVFTKECFNKWLATRKGHIQHPEQTFHRTLIAHVRGSDTRKPFSEDIESAILALLRDRKKNVWESVFGKNSIHNIGKFGFKHLGYHESKKKHETDEPVSKRGSRDKPNKKARTNSTSSMKEETFIDDHDIPSEEYSQELEPEDDFFGEHFDHELGAFDYLGPSAHQENNFGSRQLLDSSMTVDSNVASVAQMTGAANYHIPIKINQEEREDFQLQIPTSTPWQEIKAVLQETHDEWFLDHCERMAHRNGTSVLPPAVVYFLNQPPTKDFRLNESFIIPTSDSQCFYNGRQIASMKVAMNSLSIVDFNAEATRVCNRDLNNLFVFFLFGSLLESWYFFKDFWRLVKNHGEMWKRTWIRTGDGSLRVAHAKVKLLYSNEDSYFLVEFQDISDIYPEYKESFFFI